MKRMFCFINLNIYVLFLFLFISISNVLSQELKQNSFGIFTIYLPDNCQLIQEDKNNDMICKTYITPNKKFIYSYCIFNIDEDFDLKERLKEEALTMNLDIDEVGYFAVTTGTEAPLLSTMTKSEDLSLIMGIYPYYDKGEAVFVCLVDTGEKDIDHLIKIISTFRPLK